tara:strand:- start:259 stop:1272 length:1014 start_codon:yes stop_codon:yes gene_type:complete
MIKISEIFSKEELDYLSKYKPGLAPMDVPSRSDANLLTKPSVDQIVIEFLKQYEVNVEPRSVGGWNGWDTVSTISSIFAKEGSTLNIASTMFYANRSNQINSAAQDWGTWKRWALDHKNFDEYKEGVLQLVDINNQRVIKELDEQIERAEANNKIISEALLEPSAKEYISEAIKRNKVKEDKQNTTLGCLILCVPLVIGFFVALDQLSGGPANREKEKIQKINEKVAKLVQEARSKKFIEDAILTYEKALEVDPNNKSLIITYAREIYKFHDATYTAPSCALKRALQQINRNDPQYVQATQMINRINSYGWSNMLKSERDNRCVRETGWGSWGFSWR